jgi:hypothetical protein
VPIKEEDQAPLALREVRAEDGGRDLFVVRGGRGQRDGLRRKKTVPIKLDTPTRPDETAKNGAPEPQIPFGDDNKKDDR